MHLTLSVEDTNKLRERLGLKLISTEPHERTSSSENALRERVADTKHRAGITTNNGGPAKSVSEPELNNSEPLETPNLESTDSWLKRISELAQSKDSNSQPASKSDEPKSPEPIALSPAINETVSNNGNGAKTIAENPFVEKPKSSTTVSDPLDLPSEHKMKPLNVPKKAVFKQKRIKLNSTSRERPSKVSNTNHSGINTDDYYAMLMRSAIKNTDKSEIVDSPSNNNPRKTSAVLDTSGFLNRIKENVEEPRSFSVDSSVDPPRENVSEVSHEKLPTTTLAQAEEEKVEEKPISSIAETLQLIRQQQTRDVSAPKSNPKSREWARELLNSRKQREKERQELEKKISNLPQKQREEAIALFKQRVNTELSHDAKILNENYEPEVVVEHRDDRGNVITSKDAFKKMSKAFHGHKS